MLSHGSWLEWLRPLFPHQRMFKNPIRYQPAAKSVEGTIWDAMELVSEGMFWMQKLCGQSPHVCRAHVYKICNKSLLFFPGICATFLCYVCTVSQRIWMSLILLQNVIHRTRDVFLELCGRDLNHQVKLHKWSGCGMIHFIFYWAPCLLHELAKATELRRTPPPIYS